jgi:hypothetical protein
MKPGEDLIDQGIRDLQLGMETVPALLISIGAPRLRHAGVEVPNEVFTTPEHRLYLKLAEIHGNGAHSKYNALIRRLVSFERAAECGI